MKLNEAKLKAYGLTRCERELAQLIMEGLSEAEIAEKCFVTTTAIKNRKTSMNKKIFIGNGKRGYKVNAKSIMRLAEIGCDKIDIPEAEMPTQLEPCGFKGCSRCKCLRRKHDHSCGK